MHVLLEVGVGIAHRLHVLLAFDARVHLLCVSRCGIDPRPG
jgi:hypothetical protein